MARRRFGLPLFDKLGRRFPKHFGPGHVALAERLFSRWGVRAVFFGRFIIALRTWASWLAGASKMDWRVFAAWNALGGIVWAVIIGLLSWTYMARLVRADFLSLRPAL